MADKKFYVLGAAVAVLYVATGVLFYQVRSASNQDALLQKIEQGSQVYTYNLDRIFEAMNIAEAKKQYEESVIGLNNELLQAEEKIKSLKDAKVKEDFSEMYLKNLKLRRDEIVSNYEKAVAGLNEKFTKALEEIVHEQNLPAVFLSGAIAVKTEKTVDLTDQIIAKMKKM